MLELSILSRIGEILPLALLSRINSFLLGDNVTLYSLNKQQSCLFIILLKIHSFFYIRLIAYFKNTQKTNFLIFLCDPFIACSLMPWPTGKSVTEYLLE